MSVDPIDVPAKFSQELPVIATDVSPASTKTARTNL